MRRTSSVLTISRPSSAASERDTERNVDNSSLNDLDPLYYYPSFLKKDTDNSSLSSPPFPAAVTPSPITENPLREAVRITFSEPPSPTGPLPVIDSTVGNPGASTDVTDDPPQPDIAQTVAPVEPATLNPPGPTVFVDGSTSYIVESAAESIKDFEPVDHADNTAEFREAVYENADVISPSADPIVSQPVFVRPQHVMSSFSLEKTHSLSTWVTAIFFIH